LWLVSLCRQQTRLRVDPTSASNNNKLNAGLAAIPISSPKSQESPVRTTTTHFPNIPDFDTPYLLTLQDSKAQSNSRQASPSATNATSRQSNSQLAKSRRITLTSAFSLAETSSTAAAKPSQPSRSRGSSRRISLGSSAEPATERQDAEAVTVSAPLSVTSRTGSQGSTSSRSQDGNTRRTSTKSFTVVDNTNTTSKAFSLDAEISAIENSFTQNNVGQRRGEVRNHGSSRTDPKAKTKFQSQNQRVATEPVQRTRFVSEPTTTPSSDLNTSHQSSSSQSPTVPSRTFQSRQLETLASRSTSETVTPRSISQTAGSETVSPPSIRISTSSQWNETLNERNATPSPSALRSSSRASLVDTDDVNSGLSRNSIVQQSDVPTNNRARSRGSSQRKPSSCADAVDTNSNAGCTEKPQIRYNFCNTSVRQNNFINIQNGD